MMEVILDIETTGVNPCYSKIVSIGILEVGKDTARVWMGDEKEILLILGNYFDSLLRDHSLSDIILIGWRVEDFDIPFLQIRGLLHGIDFTYLDRLKTVDLNTDFCLPVDMHSRDVAFLLGIETASESGASIPLYYATGKKELIKEHNMKDLYMIRDIWLHVKNVWKYRYGEDRL